MSGLTRSDAAKYLGMRTVEGVRYLEKTGKLHPVKDEDGVHRFDLGELARVKAEREASGKTTRLSSEEVAIARADRNAIVAALREDEAWRAKMAADWEHEDRLRAEVRTKNEAARTAFERDALSEAAAGQALGFGVLERGRRLRELVQSGLLRKVQPPPELVLKGGFGDPLRIEEGYPMSIHGAPFFLRADVLAVWQETAEVAAQAVAHGPRAGEAVNIEAVAEMIRAFLASRGR